MKWQNSKSMNNCLLSSFEHEENQFSDEINEIRMAVPFGNCMILKEKVRRPRVELGAR